MPKESKNEEEISKGITVRYGPEDLKGARHYFLEIEMSLLEAHRRAIKRIIDKDEDESKDG